MWVRFPSLAPFAGVVELADMQDLGSCAERRMGSSPITSTIIYYIKGRNCMNIKVLTTPTCIKCKSLKPVMEKDRKSVV